MILTAFIVLGGFLGLHNANGIVKDAPVNHGNKTADDYDLAEGTYYIRNRAGTNKYLDVSWSCKDEPRCKVQLWSLGSTTTNDKWVIKRAGLPLVSPYTLQSVCNNKYLTGIGADNGDDLQVEARIGIGTMWRSRQEWRFKYVTTAADGSKIFKIYNEETGKYLDAVNDCVSENGCKVQVWSDGTSYSRQWFLVKTN
jgi:hypothetical protein